MNGNETAICYMLPHLHLKIHQKIKMLLKHPTLRTFDLYERLVPGEEKKQVRLNLECFVIEWDDVQRGLQPNPGSTM